MDEKERLMCQEAYCAPQVFGTNTQFQSFIPVFVTDREQRQYQAYLHIPSLQPTSSQKQIAGLC